MTNEFIAQGRIVWGHPAKLEQSRDYYTKKPEIDKQNNPIMKCSFGLAIPKDYFFQTCLPVMQAVATQNFPNGIPHDFSWKYKDGDTAVTDKGKPYAEMEGRAGTCIIGYSNIGFTNTVYKIESNGQYRQIQPEEVKCGDFLAVRSVIEYNGNRPGANPGLYVNAKECVHIGYGSEIVATSANPEEAFAGFQPVQMAGMSTQPMMNMNVKLPPQGQPQTGYAQPNPLPPPAHDFVQNAIGQQPQQVQQGFTPPASVQYAGQQGQPLQNQPQTGYAQPATGFPTNALPQGR